jgi:serine/threonine protein kinase
VWKHLVHPNIVPFKGVTFGPLQLVSEWMPNGEIRHYARKPEADLVALVGAFSYPQPSTSLLLQLLGVANGLAYLHSCSVIHGDLKGVRINTDLDT